MIGMILAASVVGFIFNTWVLPRPVLNFMLIGMAFSATFANMVSEARLKQIMDGFNPILGVADDRGHSQPGCAAGLSPDSGCGLVHGHLYPGAGHGKILRRLSGSKRDPLPETVKKYLGADAFLPHSGVSLVFTGIAVSVLNAPAPEWRKNHSGNDCGGRGHQ